MIYEPREDSFLLSKYVKKYSNGRVLDVGTGSGIQALAALEKTKDVLAVDINEEAVRSAKSKGVNARVSDLFSNVDGKFDFILFNPPYLPRETEDCGIKLTVDKGLNYPDDVAIVGGDKGTETIERFFSEVDNYLKKDGKILLCFSSITGDVESIMKRHGFEFEKLEEMKFFFEEIFVYLVYKKVFKRLSTI